LDNFKVINDTVGHSAGDKLLVRVAQMLRDLAQSEVGLVRFGGDEFVLVLQGCDEAAALNLANELREKLEHLVFHEEGVAFRVSGSIGLAEVLHQVSPEEVLSRADSACYGAKAKGRNQVEMYHPDNTALAQLSSDTNWSLVIRNAIKQGHLRLWYQPVIQLKDNEVLYHEALLRYRDPQMLTVTNAGIFLPSVERAGNIQAVDQYVLEQAFAFLKSGKVGRLGINLSIQTLAQRELIERVEKLAETHQVRPQDVVFEITETAAVSNLDRVGDTMKALQAQGYQFALDDFGSGFASLTHLERLPVNVLKIDRGLLKNVVQDPFEQAIVKALVEVARVQGLTTVAEGVEDETTLRALKDLGLDCAQGYFIGRPTSLE
jgi:diguanylate cyclase (GGDEF)-like protein